MKITNTEVFGWEAAFRGMRNPFDSWDKSDSKMDVNPPVLGENDLSLAQRLLRSGSEHSKFMRMIHVQADVDMPRYWWSEADTYHFNTKNSRSTMHKLLNSTTPITKKLFVGCEEDEDVLDIVVVRLEDLRHNYKQSLDEEEKTHLLVRAKRLLPEGFLQTRTLDTNYAELRNMYFQRRTHRLKEEWVDVFCGWIETLPYSRELIMFDDGKK